MKGLHRKPIRSKIADSTLVSNMFFGGGGGGGKKLFSIVSSKSSGQEVVITEPILPIYSFKYFRMGNSDCE